jgi:S-layer protein
LTSTFDVIRGLVAGDTITLIKAIGTDAGTTVKTADLTLAGTNLAAANNAVVFATGTYDAGAGTFTYAANGADTVMTYDTGAGATVTGESVVLVGFKVGSATTASTGFITFG